MEERLIPLLTDVLAGPRDMLCRGVLAACRPLLPPEPEEGFLPWCYRYLCAQLYPDPEARFDPALVEAAEQVYLPALTWALDREDYPFDPLTDLLPVPEDAVAESRVAAGRRGSPRGPAPR